MNSKGMTKYKLGSLADITSSKRIFLSDYVTAGVPFYRSKEIIQKSLGEEISDPLFISASKFVEIKEKFGTPERGDLLLSAVGERAGIPYVVKDEGDFYFKDGNLIWFRNFNNKVNSDYLSYWVKSHEGKNTLKSIMIGSAQRALTIVGLKGVEIFLPPIEQQERVASILLSLDDKIELNRQTNQTLESISQALFKEWFIDFNFPGATGEMQDSELGEIPKGWRVYRIGDLVESVSITHKFPKGRAIFLNTSDIEEGKILHNNYSNKESLPGQAKKTIKKFDILFTEIRPANKRYALIDFEADDFVVSTKLMVLRTISKIHPVVVYNFLTRDDTLKELQHLAESRSGTFPQITFEQVKALRLILPEGELVKMYEKTALAIFNYIKNNEEQTRILTQLRDNLLPKLMKAEVQFI
jgi:type I restriction enzyme, S subunit